MLLDAQKIYLINMYISEIKKTKSFISKNERLLGIIDYENSSTESSISSVVESKSFGSQTPLTLAGPMTKHCIGGKICSSTKSSLSGNKYSGGVNFSIFKKSNTLESSYINSSTNATFADTSISDTHRTIDSQLDTNGVNNLKVFSMKLTV